MSEQSEPVELEAAEEQPRLDEASDQPDQQAEETARAADEPARPDAELEGSQSEEFAEQQPEPLPEQEPQPELRPEQQSEYPEVPQQSEEQQVQLHEEVEGGSELLVEPQDPIQLPESSVFQEKAIEDEEMPSMLTFDNSSKIDESDVNLKQEDRYSPQPMPKKFKEDSDSDSVCVIDSDDDEVEEKNARREDGEEEEYSYDEDEEEDESSSYEEEDDDENEDDRDRYRQDYDKKQIVKPVKQIENYDEVEDEDEEEEEEEEEDEEEEEEMERDGEIEEYYREEGDEDNSEPDYFDGGSDDLVLRHSNGLNKEVKERSASLQELSSSKDQYTNNRGSFNPLSQKARFERNQERKGKPGKFDHVPSKVKKYITEMNEQRRMSSEKRKKAQEEARYKNQEISESQMRRNETIVNTCKTIKNYTEKTLKEVAEENDQFYIPPQGYDNGEITINFLPKQDKQSTMNQEQMEVDPIVLDEPRNYERIDRVNGTAVNDEQNIYFQERKGIHRRDEYSPKPISNGEDPSYVSNLRTLTYEEYMSGGPSNNEVIENVMSDERTVNQVPNIPEKCNNNDVDNSPCILEIDSITSNYQGEEDEREDDETFEERRAHVIREEAEPFYGDNFVEQRCLKSQLSQRIAENLNLHMTYQKTMSVNEAMKIELDNLKKVIARYEEKERSAPEKKTVAVQTDSQATGPALSMPLIDIDESDDVPLNPRLAANSITSAASTQWSDSIGSAAISMEPPPSITTALFSDDSATTQGKTAKPRNAFSRAFVASTRILQTLSSITTGKAKSDRYGKKGSSSKQSVPEIVIDSAQSSQDGVAEKFNSRKRKASEITDESAQPFKIPHMSNSNRPKANPSADASESHVGDFEDKDNLNDDGASSEQKIEQLKDVQELDDDVKIFLYPEDENSKEQSFLIQAKEVDSNPNRGVRECGPYLLGNVEVFMTEVNGTINIWGKELSQGSVSQNLEELDTSPRPKDLKTGLRWQSTPRMFHKNVSAPTSKKSRIASKSYQQQKQQHACEAHSNADYEHCEPHQYRTSWPACNQAAHDHQPCCPRVRVEEDCCGCRHRRNGGLVQSCKSHFLDSGRFSLPNVYQEASCCCSSRPSHCRTTAVCEDTLRHRSFTRQPSFNPTDDEGESEEELVQPAQSAKPGHSQKQNLPCSPGPSNDKLPASGSIRRSNSSESLVCENDNDPLISQKNQLEEPETRKRKRSSKRVSGLLLDLIKGNCGNCKASDSVINPNSHQSASIHEPNAFIQRPGFPSCSPHQPTCSPRSHQKCSTCRVNKDEAASVQAQLECFRIEMEKLREMFQSQHNEATANK